MHFVVIPTIPILLADLVAQLVTQQVSKSISAGKQKHVASAQGFVATSMEGVQTDE